MMHTQPNITLVNALRETARRLSRGAEYNWCHMGRCNCGHLAQTITKLSPAKIHEMALLKAGDWKDQTIDHCTTTGLTIDHIIASMMELGLTRNDIVHLERLSDQRVLQRIPLERRRKMDHRKREDVVLYMHEFARMLEEALLENVPGSTQIMEHVEDSFTEERTELVAVHS
ncbi:MAG: hypothetical protein ACOC2C_00995 [Cyclonatronaceae bacterium]